MLSVYNTRNTQCTVASALFSGPLSTLVAPLCHCVLLAPIHLPVCARRSGSAAIAVTMVWRRFNCLTERSKKKNNDNNPFVDLHWSHSQRKRVHVPLDLPRELFYSQLLPNLTPTHVAQMGGGHASKTDLMHRSYTHSTEQQKMQKNLPKSHCAEWSATKSLRVNGNHCTYSWRGLLCAFALALARFFRNSN